MALPTSVSGVIQPAGSNYSPSYAGPFLRSDGSVVVITVNAGLRANYASDPESSFTQSSAPSGISGSVVVFWAFQVGDVIHVVVHDSNLDAYYIQWLANDSWSFSGTVETVEANSTQTYLGVSLVVRSDGEVVVVFNGARDSVMGTSYSRVDYKRRTAAGSWQATVAVDIAGEIHYTNPVAVLGASDRVHFFWVNKDGTNSPGYERTLRADNSLETVSGSVYNSPTNSYPFGRGVSFVNGADTRVYVPYQGNGQIAHTAFTSADTPSNGAGQVHATIDARLSNQKYQVCMANDGTDVYFVYVETSISDIRYAKKTNDSGGWAAPVDIKVGTFDVVNANIYTREGAKVLAYVYTDAGLVYYDEYVLAAAPEGRPSVPFTNRAAVQRAASW